MVYENLESEDCEENEDKPSKNNEETREITSDDIIEKSIEEGVEQIELLKETESFQNSNVLPIDAVFMPVNKVNFAIESDDLSDTPKDRVMLEIWTNGSILPSQAINDAAKALLKFFLSIPKNKYISFYFNEFNHRFREKNCLFEIKKTKRNEKNKRNKKSKRNKRAKRVENTKRGKKDKTTQIQNIKSIQRIQNIQNIQNIKSIKSIKRRKKIKRAKKH